MATGTPASPIPIAFYWDAVTAAVSSEEQQLEFVRDVRQRYGIGHAETCFVCVINEKQSGEHAQQCFLPQVRTNMQVP